MDEFREGEAVFRANLAGTNKGPGKAKSVFYNPATKFCRDAHVALAKKMALNGLVLDGLAASGVRGIRLSLEANLDMEFCDISKMAADAIDANLRRNHIRCKVHHMPVEKLLARKQYDAIDIDPFGTPVPYLKAALNGIREGGVLGISATDTAVLCGSDPSACRRRYGATPMKGVASKEMGVRILLAKLHRLAAGRGRRIKPLVCYSVGHCLRAFVRVTDETDDNTLKWVSPSMNVTDREADGASGPLWVGQIIDKKMIPDEYTGALGRFFRTLREEADGPPGLYDMNDMARRSGPFETPKRWKIILSLRELGHLASASIFSPFGIRTTAPEEARNEAIRIARTRPEVPGTDL